MAITREQLILELEGETAAVADFKLRGTVQAVLIEPVLMRCAWDYRLPGETYPCWIPLHAGTPRNAPRIGAGLMTRSVPQAMRPAPECAAINEYARTHTEPAIMVSCAG